MRAWSFSNAIRPLSAGTAAPPASPDLRPAGKSPAQPERGGGGDQQQGNQRALHAEHAAGKHGITHQLAAQQAVGAAVRSVFGHPPCRPARVR